MLRKLIHIPIFRHFVFLVGYNLFNALIHLAIISLIAFFHFLLDHRLVDIEEWVFNFGWEIIAIGKIISLMITLKFLMTHLNARRPFYYLFQYRKGAIGSEFFISIIFLFIFTVFLGNPKSLELSEWNILRTLTSYSSILVFYFCDIFLLYSLNVIYPVEKNSWYAEMVLMAFLFMFLTKSLYVFGQRVDFFVAFNFLMLMFSMEEGMRFSWGRPLLLGILYTAPLGCFFGLDPIWNGSYSLLNMSTEIKLFEVAALFFIVTVYWLLKSRRRIAEING
jgi:hypothetical protein